MRISIHIVLFSLLFSIYAKLHVCLKYIANQKYYAEVLCVNKEVKNSCCKGKCAMEKELINITEKEEEKNSAKQPVLKIGKTEEALCSSLRLNNFKHIALNINSPYTKKESRGEVFKKSKPPCV